MDGDTRVNRNNKRGKEESRNNEDVQLRRLQKTQNIIETMRKTCKHYDYDKP